MDSYDNIIILVDTNLIYCLIPIILTLIFIEIILKNRFETKKALNLIRWTIISYTIITFIYSIIGITLHPEKFAFIDRATGPYKITYWVMFLSSLILPFTLLNRRLASKFLYVLFVAIFMKIGFYFERFVIIATSYHRDYLTNNGSAEGTNSFTFGVLMVFLQGIIITVLTLGIFEIIKRKNDYK